MWSSVDGRFLEPEFDPFGPGAHDDFDDADDLVIIHFD